MDLTLLELHLPGAQFNAPFSGRSGRPTEAAGGEDESALDSDSSTSGPGALVGLAILVGLALLAWYLRREPPVEDEADE